MPSPGLPAPPQTPPPVAATQAAPIQEQRGGGPIRKLSLDEAVQLALEQNLDVQVERINPQLQDFAIDLVRTAWTPNLGGATNFNNTDSVPDNLFAGAQDTLTSRRSSAPSGFEQLLPTGTSYSVGWDASRRESNNIFSNFNPRLFSTLSFSVAQPLLQGFKIDGTRTQLLVQQKNREISDIQLRQLVVTTVRNVRNQVPGVSSARATT